MGVTLGSNFDLNTALPLDSRDIKADVTARNAIPAPSRYIGMRVFVLSNLTRYVLKSGLLDANWEVDTAAGSVITSQATDSTTTGAGQTATLATLMHIFTNASLTSIAGLTAPASTTLGILVNRRGADITIVNDATATAANRIITGTGSDLTLKNGAAVWVAYDTVAARWQVIGGSGGGGGINNIVTKTATGTIAANEDTVIVDATAGNIVLTLPPMTLKETHKFIRKDSTANSVTIQRAGSDQILTEEGLVNSYELPYIGNTLSIAGLYTSTWGKE